MIYAIFPLLAALCWGFAQVVGKLSIKTISISSFNFIRETMAVALAVILVVIFRDSDFSFISFDNINIIACAAAVSVIGNVLNLIFLYKAMKIGSVNVVVIALSGTPAFVFIYSYLFFDEAITAPLICGMALILLSVCLLALVNNKGRSEHRNATILPVLYAIASGACQSVTIIGNKLLVTKINYYDLNLIEGVVALFVFMTLAGRQLPSAFSRQSLSGLRCALLSGIVGRAFGCLFLLIGINYTDSVIVAPLSNSSMFFAMFFGSILLKEQITRLHAILAATAFGGVLLIVCR